MQQSASRRLDDMLCFSLYSATQAMNQIYQPLLDKIGLTYTQYLVLQTLWRSGASMSVNEIGSEVGLESNTLTPLLKRMEADGLITRNRSSEDERKVIIRLTRTGKALKAKCRHVPGCVLEATGMTATQADELTRVILRLRDRLNSANPAH